jgi:hypothetical protein
VRGTVQDSTPSSPSPSSGSNTTFGFSPVNHGPNSEDRESPKSDDSEILGSGGGGGSGGTDLGGGGNSGGRPQPTCPADPEAWCIAEDVLPPFVEDPFEDPKIKAQRIYDARIKTEARIKMEDLLASAANLVGRLPTPTLETLTRSFSDAVRLADGRPHGEGFDAVVWVERASVGDVEARADEVAARVAFAQVPYDLIYIRTDT